jgi:GAF domain-containing protein
MDIESRIRSRIEAILTNDAKNHAEIKRMATEDEPLEIDPFAEERNFYQRIINSYRNAVSEVNGLLEENVGFLSSFYRIMESIKDKGDFQDICLHLVDRILQDFGAEYCSVVLFEADPEKSSDFHMEGVSEQRRCFRVHSDSGLLGSTEFEDAVLRMTTESGESFNIGDVYREPRFNNVDFPSVVRSLLCLPISLRSKPIGCLILSHSLPSYFKDNHLRVLQILAGAIAMIKQLASQNGSRHVPASTYPASAPDTGSIEAFSVVLLDFAGVDGFGRLSRINKKSVGDIRRKLAAALNGEGFVLPHDEEELLVLLPGVRGELLPERVRFLQGVFHEWQAGQAEGERTTMGVGFSTCTGDEDLSSTLELASYALRRSRDEEMGLAASDV